MDQPPTVTDPWCKRTVVWVPPPIEDRIKRQQACFLVGGVPSSVPTRKVRGAGWSLDLTARQVRECISIPFTLVEYQHVGPAPIGRLPQYSAFIIRVANRGTIRKELERVYGLSMRTLFADPGGLADYGEAFR
jgi:hypothetical protein